MAITKTGDVTGYSRSGISEAIQNALEKAGEPSRFEVVETRGSQSGRDEQYYEVTLATFAD